MLSVADDTEVTLLAPPCRRRPTLRSGCMSHVRHTHIGFTMETPDPGEPPPAASTPGDARRRRSALRNRPTSALRAAMCRAYHADGRHPHAIPSSCSSRTEGPDAGKVRTPSLRPGAPHGRTVADRRAFSIQPGLLQHRASSVSAQSHPTTGARPGGRRPNTAVYSGATAARRRNTVPVAAPPSLGAHRAPRKSVAFLHDPSLATFSDMADGSEGQEDAVVIDTVRAPLPLMVSL